MEFEKMRRVEGNATLKLQTRTKLQFIEKFIDNLGARPLPLKSISPLVKHAAALDELF